LRFHAPNESVCNNYKLDHGNLSTWKSTQIIQTMYRVFRRIVTCLEVLGTHFAVASRLEWDKGVPRKIRASIFWYLRR
jgi:hypothetical protein